MRIFLAIRNVFLQPQIIDQRETKFQPMLLGKVQQRSYILKKKFVRFAGHAAICSEAAVPVRKQEPAHNFRARVANAGKIFAQYLLVFGQTHAVMAKNRGTKVFAVVQPRVIYTKKKRRSL